MAVAAADCKLIDCRPGAAAAAALGSLSGQPTGMPSAPGPPGARPLLGSPLQTRPLQYLSPAAHRLKGQHLRPPQLPPAWPGLSGWRVAVPAAAAAHPLQQLTSRPPAGLALHLQRPALLPAAREQVVTQPAPGGGWAASAALQQQHDQVVSPTSAVSHSGRFGCKRRFATRKSFQQAAALTWWQDMAGGNRVLHLRGRPFAHWGLAAAGPPSCPGRLRGRPSRLSRRQQRDLWAGGPSVLSSARRACASRTSDPPCSACRTTSLLSHCSMRKTETADSPLFGSY